MSNRIAMLFTITGASPAGASTTAQIGSVVDTATASGAVGGSGAGLDSVDDADVIAATLGGTGGTLDLVLQTSDDNVTFTDWMHFTQIAAAASAAFQRALSTHGVNQNPTAVGQGTATTLAATTTAGGPRRYIRLIGKTGTGNTAGATQTVTLYCRGAAKHAA